MELKILAFKR